MLLMLCDPLGHYSVTDVHFNKEEMFDGNTEIFKNNIKNIFLEYLVKISKKAIRTVTIIILPTTYNNTAKDLEWSYKNEGNKKNLTLRKKKFNP